MRFRILVLATTFLATVLQLGPSGVPRAEAAPPCVPQPLPTTCAGKSCGSVLNNCGSPVSCGTCTGGLICDVSNQCVVFSCTPVLACPAGKDCGSYPDGCGGFVSCGSCTAPQQCGVGNRPNVCSQPRDALPFPAGSLVLPMDQCYNKSDGPAPYQWSNDRCVAATRPTCYASGSYPDGTMRLPFGLIYLLAANRIPVHIILRSDKLIQADPDFTVTPPSGSSTPTASYLAYGSGAYAINASMITSGTNPLSYWGMPFVVEASFAEQALQVIADFNAAHGDLFAKVPLHVINHPFDAPVLATLATRPKPVGLGPDFGLNTYFDESGITAVVPAGTSSVEVLPTGVPNEFSFTWPAALPPHPGCPGGVCSSLTYVNAGTTERIVDILWTGNAPLQFWNALPSYFDAAGRALVVSTAVTAWEGGTGASNYLVPGAGLRGASRGSAGSDFCPAIAASNGLAFPGPVSAYPASDPYLSIGDIEFTPVGGGLSSTWQFKGRPAPDTMGLTSVDVDPQGKLQNFYSAIDGYPMVNGVQTRGHVIYEGGGDAWHGNASLKDAGLRVMYNSLLNFGETVGDFPPVYQSVELSRSSPVGLSDGKLYVGTFDWKIPENPLAFGNILYQAPLSQYPYVTGHFREYKPTLSGTVSLSCDPLDPDSVCNWDAATRIKTFDQRNILVGRKVSGAYSKVTAASLSGDATLQHVAANIGQKLGGVDYATAAVIEGKPQGNVSVANAKGRPTIAYVGARDGMLHAFCVAPPAGQSTCYGSYAPGDELWAFIPPGVKAQMDTALSTRNWSKVNIGGAIRVADMQDYFDSAQPTSKVYRTVLIAATRDSGHVFALDISDPNPASFNQAGFQLLWETDGQTVANGVPVYRMGATQGATFATPNGNSGYAIVASAVYNAPGGTGSGINTYAINLANGQVVSANQKLYSRVIPLAGGSTGKLPNSVPPMPTVFGGTEPSSTGASVLIADLEGVVRKFNLTTTGFDSSTFTMFDGGAGHCSSNLACQPFGVSPTMGRVGASRRLAVFIGSGGADWARSPSAQYRAFGWWADATTTTTAFFDDPLGTMQPPVDSSAPGAVPLDMPLKTYAQLSVAGSDLYAQVSTQSLDTVAQLVQTTMFAGTYGTVLRWGNMNTTLDTTEQVLIQQGTNYVGGFASVIETNTTSTDGALTIVGTNQAIRVGLAAGSSSLRNRLYAVEQASSQTKPYSIMTWFDLSN